MAGIAMVAAVAIVAAACAGVEGPGAPAPEESPPVTQPSETPRIGGGAETVPIVGALVDSAREHLAAMLDVPVEEIEVVSQEEVTWPDGSLGCPQPGMSYTQALVEGSRIVLEHSGVRYEYHSAGDRALIYCTNPAGQGSPGAR